MLPLHHGGSFPTVWAWEVLFLQHCVWEVYPKTTDSRSASGHCRLARRLPFKHSRYLMRLSCHLFTLRRSCCYLGMIHGSPSNGFYGNDIYDITPLPFAPEYFGSLGRLNIQQRSHKIPSHMYFYLFSIALFSTLGRNQCQTSLPLPHVPPPSADSNVAPPAPDRFIGEISSYRHLECQ